MEDFGVMSTAMADRGWISSPASGLDLGDPGVQNSARSRFWARAVGHPVCTPTYTAASFPPLQGLPCKL